MVVPRKERRVERSHEIKPHFFTIIVSPALQLLKLRLPKKFVRDHGKHLWSNLVYLGVRNGVDWPVEVSSFRGSAWLSRGWTQFAEYYSLALGYLLVFRYDGRSRFRVSVFNTSAIEIDYNLHQTAHQSGKFRSLNAAKTDENEKGFKDDDTCTEMFDQPQHQLEGKSCKEHASQWQSNPRAAGKILSDAETRVKRRANAFHSRNPRFMVHIAQRNLSGNAGPVLPVSHRRTYFKNRSGSKEIVLRIHEKTWNVQLRYEKFCPFSASLTFGWRDFVLDNHLKEGDICIFELVDSATNTYNVHVFRIDGTEEDEGTEYGLSASQKANAFHSQAPSFIVPMKRRHVYYKLGPVFPRSHSKEYFTNDDDKNDIVLRVDKRTWYLKYRIEKLATFCIALSCGWKEFMVENGLEVGDECVFELIDAAQKVYNVHIFRDSEPTLGDAELKEETVLDEPQQQPGPEGKLREELASQRRSNLGASKKILNHANSGVEERANAFESRNPFSFMVRMKKRNFNCNSGPIIPTSHARTYYTRNDHRKDIAVGVNGKTWHIKCRLEKFGKFCLALTDGWKMFVVDNNLEQGDTCIFELIDSATKTYNVKLFRNSEHKLETKDDIRPERSGNGEDISYFTGKGARNEKRGGKTRRDPAVQALWRKADAFVKGGPGFIIRMSKSYAVLDRTVHVPLHHSQKYLKDKGNDANVIVVYGKSKRAWEIKYRIEESYPRLSSADWKKFRTDNGLVVGDFCAFKLLNRPQNAYKVAIFRLNPTNHPIQR